MQLARHRLTALLEELAGIEETEHEMEEVMKHVEALQYILGTAKKLVRFGSFLHIACLSDVAVESQFSVSPIVGPPEHGDRAEEATNHSVRAGLHAVEFDN